MVLHDMVDLDQETQDFYCKSMKIVSAAGVPFLVAGAYALHCYTGIERHTKDFDIFIKEEDCERAMEAFKRAGYSTELTFPHWLAKAYADSDTFIDIIFASGNGVSHVDEEWFTHARDGQVFGMPVKVCPPEEILWTKMLIQERERFDGADVAHLIHGQCETMDWARLLRRMEGFEEVLLGHLVMFGFIYPRERRAIPRWLMEQLLNRELSQLDEPAAEEKICNGTLISREQYLVDIGPRGYHDGRLVRQVMTPEEIAYWTAAIGTIP